MKAKPFVSYAQNHEDVVLARALCPDDNTGFWIDVGAGDPVVDSVTAAFAERGWHGINIEPLPAEYQRLCDARPRDTNLRVALGAAAGRAVLFEGPPENRGSSTLIAELAERYRAEGQAFTETEAEVATLADVVAQHAPTTVDFLKIDVEGCERAVVEGTDWARLNARIVVVEATEPNSPRSTHEDWEAILLDHEYRFALFDGLNRFYARADEPALLEALRVPANVHDNFVPYVWVEQLDRAVATARRGADDAAIAFEECAKLRDDLDAAQRLTSQALDALEAAARDAASAREELGALQAEHDALLKTRLHRYASAVRAFAGRLRGRRS